MEKDRTGTNSKSDKIFNAICICSGSHSKRSLLYHRFRHDPSVPVVFDPPIQPAYPASHSQSKKNEPMQMTGEADHINKRFSEFINRAKMRMRTASNVGHRRDTEVEITYRTGDARVRGGEERPL